MGICRCHDAREGVDLDEGAPWFGGPDLRAFDDGVAEQLGHDQVKLGAGERGFDEVDAGGMGTLKPVPELVCSAEQGLGAGVAGVLGGVDLDAMDELLVVVAAGGGRVGGGGGCAHKWIVDPGWVEVGSVGCMMHDDDPQGCDFG